MRALNAEAKLFVPGRGLVTPERETRRRGKTPLDRSTNPFVSKDEDVPFVGDDDAACVATTPREGDESPLSLFGDDEASALELDASTLSPATATAETETEWVRFDGDDGDDDDDDARRAMEASDASLTRPLLRSSSSSGYVEAYGASAESPTLEDRSEARAASYGAAEDAIENSPQMVVELDAVEEAVPERVVSEAAMGSGAGEPLLAAVGGGGGGAYGASADGESPKAWREMRVPLLPEAKGATYGAASPVRAPKGGGARGKVYRLKELKTPPPPITIAAPRDDDEEAETTRMDKAAQAPLLGKGSASVSNLVNYGAVDKAVEETERADVASDEKNLRGFLRNNDAPYELFEDEYDEPAAYDRDEEMLDIEDDCDEDDRPAPSAPPLAGSLDVLRERAIVDDLCCIMWTVARERLELLQPLFRSQGSSIGRITLARLRRLIQKLEPRRANPRALDRLEAMLCACGYSEDVSLSEFVHATHAGTVAATRLSTTPGVKEASVLCGYLDELMSRTPASAQTALMLGGSLHKAWLDLPRLLAKNLEPQQLCLLVATLDLADDLTMNIKGAKLHEYQAWLRWMQNMLNTAPMPREPLDVSPQPQPVAVPATKPKPELSAEELRIRRAKRDRLVALWEARDALRRASTTSF